MTLVTRHAALSDIGLHRGTNEDAYVVAPPLFAVCDGMGGAQAGEIASGLAAETLMGEWRRGRSLREAADAANAAVFARANEHPEETGMGTTLTAFVLDNGQARFVHIGDSRAYLLRDGEMRLLSDDHSLVGEMVREGKLTWEQAAVHPHRSVLSRVLGTEAIVKIDEFVTDVRPGDVLLICSDGLSGMVADVMIGKILADPDPEAAARRLIEAAKAGGGYDNITAIVVRFDDGQAASDDALGELAEETSRIEAAADEGDSAGDPDDGPAGTVDGAAGTADQLSLGVDAPGVVELAPGEQASLDLMTVSGKRARSRVFRRLALSVAVLGLVVVLGVTGVVVVNTCYFIGNDDGLLVVYSGLPVSVGPVDLYAVAYGSSRTYSSLTEQQRRLVDERDVRSQNAALQLGDRLGMWP